MSGQQGEPAIGHSHVGEVRNNNQNSHVGEVGSNNQNQQAGGERVGAVTPEGDANANQMIQMGEGGSDGGGESTGGDVDTLPPLMSQTTEVSQTVTEEQKNKIVIWGTDSRCDDPELAEFEMLECQELEAYLVEEEEEEEEVEEDACEGVGLGVGVKGGARQILLDQPVSIVDLVSDSREGGGRRTIQRGSSGQDVATMGSGGTRGTAEYVTRTEFSSENHVLVSRLSAMFSPDGRLVSALDTAGRTQATTTDSWHVPSGPSGPDGTILEDLTLASQSCTTISDRSKASQRSKQPRAPSKSTIQRADLDLNQNTTVRSEEVVVPEAQVSNTVVVGRCKCQQNMEEDQGNEKHNQNLEQRYQDDRGSGRKAADDQQDVRGSGRKAAEEHQDARGSGGKAAEDHQDVRGSGRKAAEDHQDVRGSGGKAAEDHQDDRGSGGKAAEDHQDDRGSGRKAAEDHQDVRGSGRKAAEDHQDVRGSEGKAAEDHQDPRGSEGKAAEDHQDPRGSEGKAAEDHQDPRGSGRKAAEDHQDARGSEGKAAEDHQDDRGSGRKAAEDHQDVRGSGRKAAEDHQDARGSGRKAAEDHQDVRGSGRKAAEDHQDARGSEGKAAEDHQDDRGSGRKAAEDHQDVRGSGRKAAEDHQDARGSGRKAAEDHQDVRGSGGKAAEDHQDVRGSGGKAAEDHQDVRGSGRKAAEDHQDARGSGRKAAEDHQDVRGSGGKAAEDHQDVRGSGRKAAEDHQDVRGSGGKAAEDHQDVRGSGGKAAEDHQDVRGSGRKAAENHQDVRGSEGKAAEEHKVIPPDMNHGSPTKLGTNGIQSVETRSLKKHGSFDKTSKEQGSFGQSMKKTTSFEQSMKKTTSFEHTTKKSASFDRSLKKEPFLDRTLMKEASFDRTLRKQGSFERSSSPSSLDGRKPWGSPSRSPSRPATPPWSPRRPAPCSPAMTSSRPPSSTSPAKASNRASSQDRSNSPQRGTTSGLKAPSKVCVISSIPKPISPQPPADPRMDSPHKPKPARLKIITYVRKTPQVKSQGTEVDPNEALTLSLRLSSSHPSPPTAHRKPHKAGPHSKASQVLCSSNILFDKYRQEMQKAGYFPPGTGMTSLGIKPPSHPPPHNLSLNSESFHGELPDRYMHELAPAPSQLAPQEGTGLYRSPRPRGPQLGLGAVTRQPAAAKNRTMFQSQTGQRSGVVTLSHPGQQPAPPGNNQGNHDSTDQRTPGPETSVARTLLPKPGQSRLRPPGFSALPPARLAAFGFVRSSSVSSVSSNQTTVSNHSEPCRPSQRPSSGSDDTPLPLSPVPPSHSSPQPPNAPAFHRRSVLPPARVSPTASRTEVQRDVPPAVSSPKRFAVVSPKPQSPVRGRPADRGGSGSGVGGQECERALVQKLRERCEDQARQLLSLQAELKKASLGLEVFAITTQHFCHKSESAILKERELSLELARIRDEVASSVSRWEILQQDKEELERRFERELEGLRAQQQSELGRLEERLRQYHSLEIQRLEAQQQEQLERLRTQQLEQMEEVTENHEEALTEMENNHNDTLVTLKEEHARTVKNLKMAHEQQRKSLEEDFEKLRLSLQDQVDTLTFQNRSLRDRAKRFEEALRRSTDEQIVDALAPYQHIEEDLKSLKEVLLMKNQQIHEQDVKISELERMQAQKNVFLEERVQMLQQQNEDLRARIDKNLAMSRQLSEENANLQESMEKESNEKKRLSRNNEELLWRLQSPHMSPAGSPIHRASPIHHSSNTSSPGHHRSTAGPGSPARPHSYHQ
ncbi:microtubule-associated tumor suppressor candidate 2 homolog isoform X3 [Salvelinus alpinus]|uniref:microtubule-associated tumor suppressor candidate 2 homolog isoform X3 n=1 Tax=Salvelinus alpinus TaxID=8036 RepID=UPI0039FDC241